MCGGTLIMNGIRRVFYLLKDFGLKRGSPNCFTIWTFGIVAIQLTVGCSQSFRYDFFFLSHFKLYSLVLTFSFELVSNLAKELVYNHKPMKNTGELESIEIIQHSKKGSHCVHFPFFEWSTDIIMSDAVINIQNIINRRY